MHGTCSRCSAPVNFPPSRFKLKRIFCGKACYDAVRTAYVPAAATRAKLAVIRARRSATLKPNVKCAGCGSEFYRPLCERRLYRRHFCSMACRTLGHVRRAGKTGTPGVCTHCGAEIVIRAGREGRPRYCSQQCSALARRGQSIVKNGYTLVLLPSHPRADAHGYVREHLVIAERAMGRPLRKGEVVHHRNGEKSDNRPQNLQVFASHAEHMRAHAISK